MFPFVKPWLTIRCKAKVLIAACLQRPQRDCCEAVSHTLNGNMCDDPNEFRWFSMSCGLQVLRPTGSYENHAGASKVIALSFKSMLQTGSQ